MVTSELFLDFYDIFVNELFGSAILFIIIGMIIILFICIKAGAKKTTAFIALVLFLLSISTRIYLEEIYVFILLISGGIFFLAIADMIKNR